MRVHIGTDHAGFDLKNYLVTALVADGHDVVVRVFLTTPFSGDERPARRIAQLADYERRRSAG